MLACWPHAVARLPVQALVAHCLASQELRSSPRGLRAALCGLPSCWLLLLAGPASPPLRRPPLHSPTMGSARKSVFERLGPLLADAPSPPPAVAEQQAQPLPKQRVALAHPLVARHLMLAQSEKAAAAGGAPPGLLGPAAVQQHEQHQRRQQQHRRRQRDRPHEQQRGSAASSSEGRQRRQQPDRSRGSPNGLQDELQRLQAERDAAEEMLGQMVSGSWEEDWGSCWGMNGGRPSSSANMRHRLHNPCRSSLR